MMHRHSGWIALIAGATVANCHSVPGRPAPSAPTLVTDSAQYTVRFTDGLYRAAIGFRYTNHAGTTVSADYCHIPPPPALEKRVGAEWVLAYQPLISAKPFRRSGSPLAGLIAARCVSPPRGRNISPALRVDSIPGTYRLRWVLRAGDDPDAKGAAFVEAISNVFTLTKH